MTRPNLALRDVVKALKSARTCLESLSDLSCNLPSLPERYHTTAFDIFLHHLRKPVEQRLLHAFRFVLTGIGALGNKYFSRQGSHLRQCWPEVIKWGKAICEGRHYHEFDYVFLRVIVQLFNIASSLDLDLLKDNDTLAFAVEIWKGHSFGGEVDFFTTSPLLSCMTAKSHNEKQVDYLDTHFDCKERLIVRKLLARFSAAVKSNPKDTTAITDLADLLWRLASFSASPIAQAITCSNAIPVALEVMNLLMDDPHQTAEHGFSVRFLLVFLLETVPTGTDRIGEAIDSGVLGVLIRVAANQQYGCLEKPMYLLNELQLGLVFEEIAFSAVTTMGTLARGNFDLPQLLQLATPGFRAGWTRFESLLLEQAVVFNLFIDGYAPERGSCACCRKMADRKEFKKCSGCEVTLYCSKACQKQDWPRHRKECHKVDEDSIDHLLTNGDRGSRRLATLQVNRYWHCIVSLAREKSIPAIYLGVEIIHDSVPFRIKVFDCRKVGESKYQFDAGSLEPMIAKEVLRRRTIKEDHPCLMLVISHLGMVSVSYMVYLDNNLDAQAEKACNDPRGAVCMDEKDNVLRPGARDVVEDIISRSHTLSDSNWRALWGNRPFEYLAEQATQK